MGLFSRSVTYGVFEAVTSIVELSVLVIASA
jgi:hypothetical protein